ncbi:serine hydrolase [Deinococcus apachensis]|uniref:serine hydrolase n=1 Tax=Deinococcus apachensis TaxID=309886 RepID=UPI0003A29D99|nr:serine hydrolase [Deinococcus apachensis]
MNSPFDLAAELRAHGYAGEVGVLITDLAGRELYALNPERIFPAASTIKVPLLVRALHEAQSGRLDLRERVTVREEDRAGGSGILHEFGPGLTPTWEDLLTLMIVVSDNTATNLVIDRLGVECVNGWLDGLGLGSTRLVGKLQLSHERQNEAQRRGERNRTAAWDQVNVLGKLARGDLLDPVHTALALSILSRQQLRDILGRHVPRGTDGELLYRVASKSGELLGVHHDVGVLFTPRPLVVALLSEGGLDPREHPENRDVTLLARVLWPLLAALGAVVAGDI